MSESPGLYERILAQVAEGVELPAPRPPRSSAAVVPWRRGREGGLDVFWQRRSRTLKFMGGWWAFPGGGLSRRDLGLEIRGRPSGVDEADPGASMPEANLDGVEELGPLLPPGLLACALRELFEETGLLLAGSGSASLSEDRLAAARRRLLGKEAGFPEILEELGASLDASRLVYAGRWLTPPLGPMRFDNRFFLLEWPRDETIQPEILPGEADLGEWVTPAEALDRWRTGGVVTAPPILHILETLDRDGPEEGLDRLRHPEEANLGPYRKVEFRPGVLLFPLATPTLPPASYTNAYLLGREEALLVDPGSPRPREIARLEAGLRASERQLGRRVTAIALTHHHPDHVGGVEALRRAFDVPVLAHPLTAERLARSGIAVDGSLEDGQRLHLGSGDRRMIVEVLHTPGHARGHVCLLEKEGGSLLAGDMVAGFGTIVIDPPEGSMADYLASLGRLRDLAPTAMFPGHGPTLAYPVGKLEEYIEHRRWREERILEAWRDGRRRPEEMIPTVYEDVPPIAHPLAARQIAAHLEHLGSQGLLKA